LPPRNLNRSSSGVWMHNAKIAFEKYFMRKMSRGESEPFYEKAMLDILGIGKLKKTTEPV
jgi:sulfide:quinone oxidoreductase